MFEGVQLEVECLKGYSWMFEGVQLEVESVMAIRWK